MPSMAISDQRIAETLASLWPVRSSTLSISAKFPSMAHMARSSSSFENAAARVVGFVVPAHAFDERADISLVALRVPSDHA